MAVVNYDWDELEDNIDEEYDDAGNTIADYTTEPYFYGDLVSQHRNGQSNFPCFDGQGSTTALTDSVGNVTDTYAYTAFGEVTERTGNTVNPFLYIGQKGYYRIESGEYLIHSRLYIASYGRWSSADVPFSNDAHSYSFYRNAPGSWAFTTALSLFQLSALAISDDTKTDCLKVVPPLQNRFPGAVPRCTEKGAPDRIKGFARPSQYSPERGVRHATCVTKMTLNPQFDVQSAATCCLRGIQKYPAICFS